MVEGAELLSFRVLWFVLAGFILGFATSTLWEWLYYRGKRRSQLAAAPLASSLARTGNSANRSDEMATDPLSDQSPERWGLAYHSPGIYLESEKSSLPEQAILVGGKASFPSATERKQAEAQAPTAPTRTEVNTPRLNPATLVALQTAVAQTPIARPALSSRVAATPIADLPIPPATPEPRSVAAASANLSTVQTGTGHATVAPQLSAPSSTVTFNSTPLPPPVAEKPTMLPSATAPLPAEPTHLLSTTTVTPAPAGAVMDHPDDLALIKGVGEAYKRRLYHAGIYTWRQVAESDTESLRRITRAKPNANIAVWLQQARELAEKYQRWNTTFQGPLDDLTRIDGIGAITADILYKAGLCTYEQLASALPDELAKIVPAPTVGDEVDFDGWIEAATRFASAKRRNQGLLS